MILLIDNYDSFVYNLYQLIGSINSNIKVIRNDEMTIKQIEELNPQVIIISPGPKKPKEAGIIEEVIKYFHNKIPILGVCLGHQAICEVFGGNITYSKELVHGKSSKIEIDNDCSIFKGLPKVIEVARYHSLVADSINKELIVIGRGNEEIMAVKHIHYPVYGVQFHPESILTKDGKVIIENFLKEANL